MVEGYLMSAKSNFEKFKEAIGVIRMDGDDYQIYIPKMGVVIGYFIDKNFELSENRFCDTNLKENKKNKLDYKVKEEKFIKKFDVNNAILENILNSFSNLEHAKETFNNNLGTLSNICKFTKV